MALLDNPCIRLAAAGYRNLAVMAEDGCGYGIYGQLGLSDSFWSPWPLPDTPASPGPSRWRWLTRVPQAAVAEFHGMMVGAPRPQACYASK